MADTYEKELTQGSTWEIPGKVYAADGVPLPWDDFSVRAMARKTYDDALPAWVWVCTTGVAGDYTLWLGAVASAAVAKGTYYSDVEVYSRTNPDIVYSIKRLIITVLPEATK